MPRSPSYPTVGEALRFVADALDADLGSEGRAALGRFAREEVDPARAHLIEEDTLARLVMSVPSPYQEWWGRVLRQEVKAYKDYVVRSPIGYQSRAAAVLRWIEHRSQSWTLPKSLFEGLVSAASFERALAVGDVLDWLVRAAGGSLRALEQAVESARDDLAPESLERKWRSWKHDTLPDRASITELAQAGLRAPRGDLLTSDLIEARFLIARGFAFAQRARDALWDTNRGEREVDPGPTADAIIRIVDLSDPRREAGASDEAELERAIDDLEGADVAGRFAYLVAFGKARCHAKAGKFAEAVGDYERALDHGLYRAGPLVREVLREGMVVAAECGRRDPFRRFYGTAHRFGLLEEPYDDLVSEERLEAVTERWKMKVPTVFPRPYHDAPARTSATSRLEGAFSPPGLWVRQGREGTLKKVKVNSIKANTKLPGFGQRRLTPIVIAAGAGDSAEVKRVLALDGDPNWIASDGSTALIRCLQTCEQTTGEERGRAVRAARILLKEDLGPSIDSRTRERRLTTLGAAVDAGLPDLVRLVLEQGASADGPHGVEEASPLYWALCHWTTGQIPTGAFLSHLGAQGSSPNALLRVPGLPPMFSDEADRAHAQVASSEWFRPVADGLFQRRRARVDDFEAAARVLLAGGASPNAVAANGFTPLLFAVQLYSHLPQMGGLGDDERGVLLDLIGTMVEHGGQLDHHDPEGKSGWAYALEAADAELLLRVTP